MFFTFPEDAHWNAERRPSSPGSRSATIAASSGSRDVYSSAYCQSGPPPCYRRVPASHGVDGR
jgi:hypothetical protein